VILTSDGSKLLRFDIIEVYDIIRWYEIDR
jgi:hypothetical protein